MARYIDADNLIAHLKDEIEGCKKPFGSRANGKGIAYGTELGLKSAISFANTLATADVVPKSEVEKLEKESSAFAEIIHKQEDEIQQLRKSLLTKQALEEEFSKSVKKIEKQALKTIEKAKQEVAREIFEDMQSCLIQRHWNGLDIVSFEFDAVKYAELKKKYMGSVIVGEWKFDEKINTEQPDLSNVKFIDKDGNITNRDDALDWNEAPPLEESEGKG